MAHRFYAEKTASPSSFLLSPEDAHHALRVLRLRPGDAVELFAGGRRYAALLAEEPGSGLSARILNELPSTEPRLEITLFQGLPKADKMEWIIQKGVELGISRIVPVRMSRCVVRLDERDVPRKLERWQRIAREAGKQTGRCSIPEIESPVSLGDLPARAVQLDACTVPWEECTENGPLAFSRSHPDLRTLGIVIGPEGGIAPEEMDVLLSSCHPLTLGRRILRTETAGLAAAAAFLALYGEMEYC